MIHQWYKIVRLLYYNLHLSCRFSYIVKSNSKEIHKTCSITFFNHILFFVVLYEHQSSLCGLTLIILKWNVWNQTSIYVSRRKILATNTLGNQKSSKIKINWLNWSYFREYRRSFFTLKPNRKWLEFVLIVITADMSYSSISWDY